MHAHTEKSHLFPSPSERGWDDGQGEAEGALAGPMLPDAEVNTAVGLGDHLDPWERVRVWKGVPNVGEQREEESVSPKGMHEA
jgi:hypothetical protein